MREQSVTVIGLGYVGLPTAVFLSSKGFSVTGVDIDLDLLERIRNPNSFFTEPGISDLVVSALSSGALKLSDLPDRSDVFIVCVPTPVTTDEKLPSADLVFVESAIDSIAELLEPGNLVLIESTCPPGTTESMSARLASKGVRPESVFIAYCPERILPGSILAELDTNARLVGGLTAEASSKARDFYASFLDVTIVESSSIEVELAKLAENSFRDVNLAFANELSLVAASFEVDPFSLISLANLHPRVNILGPGPGPGGHCVPVDPWFLISARPSLTPLMKTARDVNDSKASWIADQIVARTYVKPSPSTRSPLARVTCLGITYKADSDDIRDSRALKVCEELQQRGLEVEIVDPFVESHPSFVMRTMEEIEWDATLVVVLVPHSAFESLKLSFEQHRSQTMDFCGFTAPVRHRIQESRRID